MGAAVFSFYVRCPVCTELLLRTSVADEDHLDPTRWTDGARHEALVAQLPSVWMCPACRHAFHALEQPQPALERASSTPTPARVREAEGVELARALSRGLARSQREERRLRLCCWWRLNDAARLGFVSHRLDADCWAPGPALRANLRALRPLLDESVPADRLTLAEVARELGEFELSERLLEPAVATDPLAQLLRQLVSGRVRAPAQVRMARWA